MLKSVLNQLLGFIYRIGRDAGQHTPMRMAGRFSRRIRGYAKAQSIPVVHCPAEEHELVEE
jgi:hypothetical protein